MKKYAKSNRAFNFIPFRKTNLSSLEYSTISTSKKCLNARNPEPYYVITYELYTFKCNLWTLRVIFCCLYNKMAAKPLAGKVYFILL